MHRLKEYDPESAHRFSEKILRPLREHDPKARYFKLLV